MTEKQKNAGLIALSPFRGLDASTPLGDDGAALDMENFKVLADGSLCTRDGFAPLASVDQPIRGMRFVRDGETEYLLAVAGNRLYRISVADGSEEHAEVFSTEAGIVGFFDAGGLLYIADGTEIYRYGGGVSVSVERGYVPLFGKDWEPNMPINPIHEPINMLSDRVRIHYRAGATVYRLFLGVKAVRVNRILCGGREPHGWSLEKDGESISFAAEGYEPEGEDIEVFLTLDPSYRQSVALCSCTLSAKYDSFQEERVFLYGGAERSLLHISSPVTEADAAISLTADPEASTLYFPMGQTAAFDDGREITAVVRAGNSMMICTEDSAWLTDDMTRLGALSGDDIVLRAMALGLGCASRGGAVAMHGGTVMTLSDAGLLRWHVDSDPLRCSADRVSDGIAPKVGADFWRNARMLYVPAEEELWLYRPDSDDEGVYVYHLGRECWYVYTGVDARGMAVVGSRVCFCGATDIFQFQKELSYDRLPSGDRPIDGYFRSCCQGLGAPERLKRVGGIYCEAELGDGHLSVELYDGTRLGGVDFNSLGEGPRCYGARIMTPRFGRLTVELRAVGTDRRRIYSLLVDRQ